MPPESSVAEMETREGLGPFDKLSDIDLWIDGEPSDLTAVFRIKHRHALVNPLYLFMT